MRFVEGEKKEKMSEDRISFKKPKIGKNYAYFWWNALKKSIYYDIYIVSSFSAVG